MKQTKKTEQNNYATGKNSPPSAFETVMNIHCDLRMELGLAPLEHWQKTRETPQWTKNICRNFRNTIFKSIRKLKPGRTVNWQHYGQMIGIAERYKIFLTQDAPRILKEEGFDKISATEWEKIQARLGEEEARQYCLKILERPATDNTPLDGLFEIITEKQLVSLDKMRQTALAHVAGQNAKTAALFWKGVSKGFTLFLNEECEFGGDDRRFDILTELLAWQYDVEKMRKSIPPKNRKVLFGELKKLPEYKTMTQEWFNGVCRDIELSIGRRGRPWEFSKT